MKFDTQFIIDDLKKAHLLHKVRRIILFGSRARGDENPTSDFDLAFDAPDLSQKEWLDILNVLENTDTLLKIDAVHYNLASENLQLQINREGVVLYERN